MSAFVLVSFSTFIVVAAIRTVLEMITDRPLTTPWKLLVTICVASIIATLLLPEPSAENITIGIAAAGGAALIHRVHRLLGAVGDLQRLQFMQGDTRRYRP